MWDSYIDAVYQTDRGRVFYVQGDERPRVRLIGHVDADGAFTACAYQGASFDRATIAAKFAPPRCRVRRALANSYLVAYAKACEDTHPRPLPAWAY